VAPAPRRPRCDTCDKGIPATGVLPIATLATAIRDLTRTYELPYIADTDTTTRIG
jgi:hypothetical protein